VEWYGPLEDKERISTKRELCVPIAMSILRPMTEYEYAEWLQRTLPAYAADKTISGQWPQDESLQRAKKEYEELLPQGLATPENFFYIIEDSDSGPVGVLWFAVKTMFNARVAYVYDVEVQPRHRLKGNGYRAFRALEQEAGKLGLSGIALHVFGHNVDAQAFYAKLGFRPTNINLFKPVTAGSASAPVHFPKAIATER
jgi:GNAT superfamily N-acetyltransferase